MATLVARRRKVQRSVPIRREGWKGMFTDAGNQPPREGMAHLCLNCLPAWPGGPITARPGITAFGATAGNIVFALFSFYTAASVLVTGRLVKDGSSGGAHIDTYNWTTGIWTTRVSAAVLFAAGLDLPTPGGAAVHWIPFHGTIVFTDDLNNPWTWDGTNGAGVVRLTNAPVAYGRAAVYYAKLFFIKNSERNTIVWSEENQANTGYEAGGFNNAWSLTQTSSAPLIGLYGTNDALLYWRSQSTGRILGPVTPSFSTSGVHDGVSATVGCGDFRSITRYGTDTFWMDNGGRFQVLPDGGGLRDITPFNLRAGQVITVDPFGFEAMGWIRPQPTGAFGPIECVGAAFTQSPGTGGGTDQGRVVFTLQGGTTREWVGVIMFDAGSKLAQCYCTFPTTISQLATVTGPTSGQALAFSTPTTVSGAANLSWLFGIGVLGAAAGGADVTYNGTAAISCTFMDGPVVAAAEIEQTINRLDLVAFVDTTQTTPAVSFGVRFVSSEFPSASVTPVAQSQSVPTSGTITTYTDQHLSYGVFTICRWFRPVVQWNMGTGNEAVTSGLKAVIMDSMPSARPPRLL